MSNNFTKRKSSLFTGIQVGCTILMVVIAVCTYNAADKSADAARDSADAATKANEISERFYQLEIEPQIVLLTPKISDKEINYLSSPVDPPLVEIYITNPSEYTIPDVRISICFIEWGNGVMDVEKAKERSEIKEEDDYYGYELIEQVEIREIKENYPIDYVIDKLEKDRNINSDIKSFCIEFLKNLPHRYIKTKYIPLGVLFPNDIYRITLPNNLREKYLYVILQGFNKRGYLYCFKVKEERSN